MSIPYPLIQDYLKQDAIHIASLRLVLSLPSSEDSDKVFFQKFKQYITEKYYGSPEGSCSFSRIKYFAFFEQLNLITEKAIIPLSNPLESPQTLNSAINTLYQSLLCELELLQNCEDPAGLDIVPVFTNLLDYLGDLNHLSTLYTTAITHFNKTAISVKHIDLYSRLFYAAVPFVRLLGTYEFNVQNLLENIQGTQGSIRNNFIKIASESGKNILDYLSKNKDTPLIPHLIVQLSGSKAGRHEPKEYFNLVSEAVIAHYIVSNRIQDLIILAMRIHSFYGVFYTYFNSKTNISLPEFHLAKSSIHIQATSFTAIIDKFFADTLQSAHADEKTTNMRHLALALRSLSEWLLVASRQHYFQDMVEKLIIPSQKDEECKLLAYFASFDKLLATEEWKLDSFTEFEAFSCIFDSHTYLYQDILHQLVGILVIIKHQMINQFPDASSLYENSALVSEFLYLQRKLDLEFKNKLSNFNFSSGYFLVHLLNEYLWWINVHAQYNENVVNYLIILISRLEDLCTSSLDPQLTTSIQTATDPSLLIEKHYLALKLFKWHIVQILEENHVNAGSLALLPLLKKLDSTELLGKILALKSEEQNVVSKKVLENVVSTFGCVVGLLNVQFYSPESACTSIINEDFIDTLEQIVVAYIEDQSRFLEASYIVLELLRTSGLKEKAIELASDLIQKFFVQFLPSIECYNPATSDKLWKIPLWESTFMVLDPHSYKEEPKDRDLCQNYSLGFFQGMNNVLKELNKEFLSFEFSKDNALRNQLFLSKLKSSMHHVGTVLQKALPLAQSIVHDLLDRKEVGKLEVFYKEAESIFLSPLFHMLSPSYQIDFLRTIKGAYVANASSFGSGTIDRVYKAFLDATVKINENLKTNERNPKFLDTLSEILEDSQTSEDRAEKLELEAVEILGAETISCLLTLEGLHQFFETLFEGYEAKVSQNILDEFVKSFGAILRLSHTLDTSCNTRFMNNRPRLGKSGSDAADAKARDTGILLRTIYTVLFTEHLCTDSVMDQLGVIGPLLKEIESFLVDSLGKSHLETATDGISIEAWSKQISAFNLAVSFLSEVSGSGETSFKFIGFDAILKTLLNWVSTVLKHYSNLPACGLSVLVSLDARITEFINYTWVVLQNVYNENQEEEPNPLLRKLAQKEEDFYDFLCGTISSDLSYYVTLHLEPHVLQSMFQTLYELIQIVKQYMQDEEKTKNTLSHLKDSAFLQNTQGKLKDALMKALKSPYIFSLILSNQDCLDILNQTDINLDITRTLHDLVQSAHQYAQGHAAHETQHPESPIADLSLKFLNHSQRGLCIMEFLSHSLSIVNKMPFDFDPSTLELNEASYELELGFLSHASLEIFKGLHRETQVEALRFCYNSLYTSTLQNAIKKNLYKATLDADSKLEGKNYELMENALKATLHQFTLQKAIKEAFGFRLLRKSSFEPYMYLISLWWVDAKACLMKLTEQTGTLETIIENAKTTQNLELVVYFLSLYALNAFPANEMTQIILKSLVHLDKTGQLVLTDPRLDIYEVLSGQNLVQAMQNNFSIEGVLLNLIGEAEGENGYGILNVSQGAGAEPLKNVSVYEYLMWGMNNSTKRVLNVLLESFLKHFDVYVTDLQARKHKNSNKVLRIVWILSVLLSRFPELAPYIMSYTFEAEKYQFTKNSAELAGHAFEGKISLLEFLVRIFLMYFPACELIQEAVCSPQKPIVVRIDGKDSLLEEVMVKMYLEEILSFLKEDLKLNEKKIFSDSPFSLWRWETCLLKAYDIIVTCRSTIAKDTLDSYIAFLLKCMRVCRRNNDSFTGKKLLKDAGKLLEGITFFIVVNNFTKNLKQVDNRELRSRLQGIVYTKEGLKMVLFLARKARDSVQKKEGGDNQQGIKKEKIEEEERKESFSAVRSAKDFQKFNQTVSEKKVEGDLDEIFFCGPSLRKCQWTREEEIMGQEVNLAVNKKAEGYLKNIIQAQEDVLTVCRGHSTSQNNPKEALAMFTELQDAALNAEAFTKNCLEVIYQGWNSDYASEKTWRKLEVESLEAVGNIGFGHSNANLLEGGFKEALGRELIVGYGEVQAELMNIEAEGGKGEGEKVAAQVPAQKGRQGGEIILEAVRLLKKEGSAIRERLYNHLETKIMKEVEAENWTGNSWARLNEGGEIYNVEEYLAGLSQIERVATCYYINGVALEKLSPEAQREVNEAKRALIGIVGSAFEEERELSDDYDDEYDEHTMESFDSEEEEEEEEKGEKPSKNGKKKKETIQDTRNEYFSDEEDQKEEKKPEKVSTADIKQEEGRGAAGAEVEEGKGLLGIGKLREAMEEEVKDDKDALEVQSTDSLDPEVPEKNNFIYTNEEEREMNGFYHKELSGLGIVKNLWESVGKLPEESLLDIVLFFAEESFVKQTEKDKEADTLKESYYRQVETLMVNPENQELLLQILTFIINCPFEYLTVDGLNHYSFEQFTVNVLSFLHYYVRANPESFFRYIPQELLKQRHTLTLNALVKRDKLPERISQILEIPFFNRVFPLISLNECRTNKQLLEGVVDLLLLLVKTSKKLGHPLPVSSSDLNNLKSLFSCCESFDSSSLLMKASHLLRVLTKKSECSMALFEIERAIIQGSISELAVCLRGKYKLLDDAIGGQGKAGTLIPLENSQNISRDFLRDISKIYKMKEILKCMNYNLSIEGIRKEVLNFFHELKDLEDFKELIKSLGETLIAIKKVENLALYSVIDAYVHSLVYSYLLLREAITSDEIKTRSASDDQKLLNELEKSLLQAQEFVCQVYKTAITKIVREPKELDQIRREPLRKVLDLDFKKALVVVYFQQQNSQKAPVFVNVGVKRSQVVGDTVRSLDFNRENLSLPNSSLQVSFIGERNVGAKQEWITQLAKEIFNPEKGLFVLSQNKRSLFPSSQSFLVGNSLHLFRIAGNVIGLSIKEGLTSGISFTKAFLKSIVGQKLELSDLREVDLELAEQLEAIRTQGLGNKTYHFTYESSILGSKKVLELVENGKDKKVTAVNKEEYIGLVIQTRLGKEIEPQLSAFTKGLFEIIPDFLITSFLPGQLENLICGPTEIDLEQLSKHIEYKNCSTADQTVRWLWEVLEEFTNEDRRSFLQFVTGSSTLPSKVSDETKIKISKVPLAGGENAFIAAIESSELTLPGYNSKDIVRENLKKAIHSREHSEDLK